ncbi:MAG: hypothetical protein K1X67_16080 [Fimbriimonadaceae bacterium]|nr:hypothetical protein [Fimbriimonadaceae bacterium]
MTPKYKLGLHGRLLGGSLNGRANPGSLATNERVADPDGRYRDLDVPTYLRRRLAIPGLRRGEA